MSNVDIKTLLVLNDNPVEPLDYDERRAAKAVVVDEENNILTLGQFLLGGGVEKEETYEEALHREVLEEAGIQIEILQPLGFVVSYRDMLRRKYVTAGYLCKFKKKISDPTTTHEYEKNEVLKWRPLGELRKSYENEIEQLILDKKRFSTDEFQSSMFHKQMILAFLKKAFG